MILTLNLIAAMAVAGQLVASPEQPNAALLAQAQDRCMVTYAVRLTKTAATDPAIFSEAELGCKTLKQQLYAAITKEYAADQAAELTTMLDAQAKPNFLTLLQRIRTDRVH